MMIKDLNNSSPLKILMINGSPRPNGNTAAALAEMKSVFDREKIESEIIDVGSKSVRGCIACGKCYSSGKCVFDDIVNVVAPKFEEASGLVLASPVYYASVNATLLAFLDRLFYSTHFDKTMKVGASVVCCRRAGSTASFDELNKFFTISGMPIVSSQYWNMVHGTAPGESKKDEEGMQTMRVLARNMTFLIMSIELGKKELGPIESEKRIYTNFI